jgi:hypothetical protein
MGVATLDDQGQLMGCCVFGALTSAGCSDATGAIQKSSLKAILTQFGICYGAASGTRRLMITRLQLCSQEHYDLQKEVVGLPKKYDQKAKPRASAAFDMVFGNLISFLYRMPPDRESPYVRGQLAAT